MRENHPSDLVRKLQAPSAHEGHEERALDNGGIVKLWVRQPCHLDSRGHGEWKEQKQRMWACFLLRRLDCENIHIRINDIECEAKSGENHKRVVKSDIGDIGEDGQMIDVEKCQDRSIPECRPCGRG